MACNEKFQTDNRQRKMKSQAPLAEGHAAFSSKPIDRFCIVSLRF
jgi:hypothetical protein